MSHGIALRLSILVATLAILAIVLVRRPWRDALDVPLAKPAPTSNGMDKGLTATSHSTRPRRQRTYDTRRAETTRGT